MTRGSKLRKRSRMVTFRETWPLHAMLMIPILAIFLFGTIPLLGGIAISFENFKVTKGIFGSKFVGLKNYAYIFKMPDTAELIRNTVVIAMGKNLLTQLVALFLLLYSTNCAAFVFGAYRRRSSICRIFFHGSFWRVSFVRCCLRTER